jgi:signal transduction histidine kinase
MQVLEPAAGEMNTRLEELEATLAAMPPEERDSRERVDLLIGIADELFSGDDPQRLVEVVAEIQELAHRLGYAHGEAWGMLHESVSCCFLGEHERGLERTEQSRKRLEALGDKDGAAKAVLMRANVLRSIGSFDQALPGFYEALAHFKKTKDRFWQSECYYNLGLLYQELGDCNQALENHKRTVSIMEDLPHHWLLARALNGIGRAYYCSNRYEQALEYHHQSLAIFRDVENEMGEARALDDIGTVYQEMGDYGLALPFHAKALQIREAIGQRRGQCTSLINIGRVHVRKQQASKALLSLRQALQIAEETGARGTVCEAHRLCAEAYEMRGNTEQALTHYKEYQRVREQVYSEAVRDRVRKLEISFEVERAEQEAEIERLKNVELKEKNDKLEELIRELHETQAQLVQSEKTAALGRLVAGVVHEMNTPMGASNSAIDLTERCVGKITTLLQGCDAVEEHFPGGELQKLFESVRASQRVTSQANARMTTILNNLKRFIRLDAAEREVVDLHEGIEATLALLEAEHGGRVTVEREYGDLPRYDCAPGDMNQVFMSLLTNAFESINGSGTVKVRTLANESHLRVEIEDTGKGIPPDMLPRIFEFGLTNTGSRVKAGMGLLVSHGIVRAHKGTIEAKSTPGAGSTFTVVLPRNGR